MDVRKANFFIVGAPKCATTSVYRYLDSHPMVFMSKPKELNYFSAEDIKEQGLYYKERVISTRTDYDNVFDKACGEKILGDASVSYFHYSSVPERIYEYNRKAKILIILRDPVERAYSHYLMDKRLGYIDTSFEDVFHNRGSFTNHFQQYFQLSLYFIPVARYMKYFGERNVKVLFDVDIMNDTELVLSELSDFLGIQNVGYAMNRQHNTYKEPRNAIVSALYSSGYIRRMAQKIVPRSVSASFKRYIFKNTDKPEVEESFKRELYRFYHDDITQLEKLIDKDLSYWCLE